MPYESGMDPIHDARRRFDVRFHLVAIAFLVFDVELLFLYPWAVAMRQRRRRMPIAARDQWICAGRQAGSCGFTGAMVFLACWPWASSTPGGRDLPMAITSCPTNVADQPGSTRW